MGKILLVSIWLTEIPKICLASVTIIGNFCFSIRNHVKAHEQVFASTKYPWNKPNFQHTMSL
jgi:hypothetical protein